jgi:hypothetical protein
MHSTLRQASDIYKSMILLYFTPYPLSLWWSPPSPTPLSTPMSLYSDDNDDNIDRGQGGEVCAMEKGKRKPIRPVECGDCEHFRIRPSWLGCSLIGRHWRNLFECPLGLVESKRAQEAER